MSWGIVYHRARDGTVPAHEFSDALADELVRADLAHAGGDLESALADLAALRKRLPPIDGAALAREARGELERRGSLAIRADR